MDSMNFRLPRFNEFPPVPLYKEQVITYMEEILKPIDLYSTEKLLTPMMLNNYVKQKIVSPPRDKKYTNKHLAYLVVVCLLKQVFSLNEICQLIRYQISHYPTEYAYDYFCVEIEHAYHSVFITRDFSYMNTLSTKLPQQNMLLRSVIISFTHTLFVRQQLTCSRDHHEDNIKET